AAGISESTAGFEVHSNSGCVGWRRAVQDLRQRGDFFVWRVTRESVNRQSAGVTQQVCERNFFLGGELVVGELPGRKLIVDVLIERNLALLDFFKRGHCRDRFADRTRLKQSLGGDRFVGISVLYAV